VPQPPKASPPALGLWRTAALFEGARPEAIAAIANASRPVRFSAGQVLFHRGDAGDQVLALASGRIKLALLTTQGRELVLRHAEAGDFLGELAFLDGTPRSAMAVAVTPGEGVILQRRAFDQIEPSLRDSLIAAALRYVCQRLRETTDQLESIALYGLSGRLARFFLLTLRQLHGDEMPEAPRLRLSLTQGELAAVLGASRPKVNRALQELEDAGAVLREEGGTLVCDPAKLLSLADASGG
jgi:CRP/FNR family transcriptional regulator, cyclic AMP receptor protein